MKVGIDMLLVRVCWWLTRRGCGTGVTAVEFRFVSSSSFARCSLLLFLTLYQHDSPLGEQTHYDTPLSLNHATLTPFPRSFLPRIRSTSTSSNSLSSPPRTHSTSSLHLLCTHHSTHTQSTNSNSNSSIKNSETSHYFRRRIY